MLRDAARNRLVSPGAAYALENHLYWLGTFATYLVTDGSSTAAPALTRLLDEVAGSKLLVANTATFVHGDKAFSKGARLSRDPDGTFVVEGKGGFVSLASFADRLIVQAGPETGQQLFVLPLPSPTIRFGPLSFPEMMIESDTHGILFERTRLTAQTRLEISSEHFLPTGRLTLFTDIWHFTLTAAQFLGAAIGALDEACRFAKSFKGWDGRELSRLDGVIAGLGQLGIRLDAAIGYLRDASREFGELGASPSDAQLQRLAARARAVNWSSTHCAEEIVSSARQLLGTRIYSGNHRLERLSREVAIGPLVPRSNGLLEREVGRHVLERGSRL